MPAQERRDSLSVLKTAVYRLRKQLMAQNFPAQDHQRNRPFPDEDSTKGGGPAPQWLRQYRKSEDSFVPVRLRWCQCRADPA